MSEIFQRFQQFSPGMQAYTFLVSWVMSLIISTGLVQLLWNTTLPKIGPFGRITYWQALRLILLVTLLTGAFTFFRIIFR